MGPWCKNCSRKGYTESKCYKKPQKEKIAFNAESAFYVYNPSAEVFAVSEDLAQFLGSALVNSLGGSKYFLPIIDDFSSEVDVFTLKNENEVITVFREYLSRVERELDLKLKSVRTDNGMEFCYKEFEKIPRELGIKSEQTTIFTPELNRDSERFNRSSMDAVRTLLQDSGLQPRFWAEARQNYVYTKNRCIHKLTEGKTPVEIWPGHKPYIKHCRIFGSLVHVYVPKVYRNKLQPKAKIGIFMGYAVSRRGYRVWLPKEGKIEESYHVKMDETKNGVQILFDISTWERLEKPRNKSKRVDVYYYPPRKERLGSLNDAKRYCEKNNLAFDPDQFIFKPTTVNTCFEQKSDSEEEMNSDSLGWNHAQIDVKAFYLYGKPDTLVYMQHPEGFVVKGCGNHVCRLQKSIYGLHPRRGNLEFNRILIKLGFQQNELCNGLYTETDCILLVDIDDGKKVHSHPQLHPTGVHQTSNRYLGPALDIIG
ncbi:Retrovirus-related Pol polyprotein like [Argiope bruennichi]|uniref:Retrovirus-related Pol polyprotein like n=1 Tax=Argiope bruennichi TaxID=94029 RepID=A0A8T0FG96_ARGBR|nr:Retrovirus-related Pol polyprotein like [Argiope bruennichi]